MIENNGKKDVQKLFEELQKAKQNCYDLLENSTMRIDMHGLEYRASRVEELRQELKILL